MFARHPPCLDMPGNPETAAAPYVVENRRR